ncbi:MAG: ATP-binding cassette domain-containing protein [bacterium]
MALLTLNDIQLSFGGPLLLDNVSLSVEPGERICLIGRNGAGKSTLMKLIIGEILPEDGRRVLQGGVTIARLEQEVPQDVQGSVFDLVASGAGELADLVRDYHHAVQDLSASSDEGCMNRLAEIQHQLEEAGGWQIEDKVNRVINDVQLSPDVPVSELSGGMKRRALLARAMVTDPDLLLLDEPTNHLDIESIKWLENFLLNWRGALLFITHDRAFLQQLATRIIELDRGQLTSWPGSYQNYLRRKAETENAENLANARQDKLLAQEEAWIRQGIKARRTRNEGRVRQLKQLREEVRNRREKQGRANFKLNAAERSGKLVCEAQGISYAWDSRPIVKDLDITIMRGDRIGIIGPNGCGKSTLLNLLLGHLQPQEGQVRIGENIRVAYFDQLREQLRSDWNVADNVAEGREKIEINGRSKHIISYLQDFLFTPERARQPIDALSGGERNRLLLAKLFSQPANVLVLDEPTNDLDVETLELLEELLTEYQGTLLLVSHDRQFLDNVVTSTLVFEGGGEVKPYVGGYNDWLNQRKSEDTSGATSNVAEKATKSKLKASAQKKLSYMDQRELDALPEKIESLETRIEEIHQSLADPELYSREPEALGRLSDELKLSEQELELAYERWEQLDSH